MQQRTKRVKIVTGLKCNIQCVFCYYRDNLKAPNRKLEEIKQDLLYARRHGITEVDFSGGEPTIHPGLNELIEDAKKMGIERVSIISNGWRLADREYMKSLKASGLNEVLFSLHGPTEEIHEGLTATKGTFERISRAFANAADEGLMIRTNTVVNRINFEKLSQLCEFVIPFRPAQVNFITVNDWCFAKHLVDKLMVRYSEMSPRLKEACDLLDKHVEAVNVRYIPFCFMQGYERFVCDHRQAPFDRFEWVPRVRARLEEQNSAWKYLGILGYGFFVGGAGKRMGQEPLADLLDDCVTEALRKYYYTKSLQCKKCSLERICDAVENTYAGKFGLDQLSPIEGDKISDPMFFRTSGPAGAKSS